MTAISRRTAGNREISRCWGTRAASPESVSISKTIAEYVKSSRRSSSGCSRPSQPTGCPSRRIRAACPGCSAGCRAATKRNSPLAPGRPEQRLDVGPGVEEIDRLRPRAPLLRQRRTRRDSGDDRHLGERAARHVESAADLEQPHARLLPALVLEQRLHEARPQRHAHRREVGRDRVAQCQRRARPGRTSAAARDRRSCR